MRTLKIASLLAAAAGSFFLSSCGCCTGVEAPQELGPRPQFKSFDVDYAK